MSNQGQLFSKCNIEAVHLNNHPPPQPEQSKDEILKARFTAADAEKIKAFCRGRQISVSDYLRHLNKIDPQYFDHVDLLNRNADLLVPLLDRISKRK